MFGYTLKQFAKTWLLVLLVFVIGASWAFGYKPATGTVDLFGGFRSAVSTLGGFSTTLGVLVLIGILCAIGAGVNYVAKQDYTNKDGRRIAHVLIGVGLLTVAVLIGLQIGDVDVTFRGAAITLIPVIIVATIVTAVMPTRQPRPKMTVVEPSKADTAAA